MFENNNFFDYCKTTFHKKFFTVSENNLLLKSKVEVKKI